MKISLTLLETDSKIKDLILIEIKKVIDNAINKSIKIISNEIKFLIAEALRSQPEYSSLMAGTLKAEFGISNPGSIPLVIDALIDTLDVKNSNTKISSNGIIGGFTITMMKSDDMNGVISANIATVSDENKGYVLPWLEWLLYGGNEIIVQNYEVVYGNFSYSRSGMAIMKPSSGAWKVPSEFAGTEDNNWTTRAINSVEDNIYKIIQKNIEQYL
jgi:hypothetical protein